jgi:hypothetical protein
MAIREGRWDCPSCGSKAVFGRHVDCPGCGKPRPAGIRFYLTDDAPVITDAAQLAEAKAGADWICEHCGASTRATETDCGGCGAPRGTSPSQPVIDYGPGQVPRSVDASPAAPAESPPAPEALLAPAPGNPAGAEAEEPADAGWTCPHCQHGNPRHKRYCGQCHKWDETRPRRLFARGQWGCTTAMVLVPLAVVALFAKGCYDQNQRWKPLPLEPGMVVASRWERSIHVEERTVVEDSGFHLPDSAQVLSRQRAIERYDSVPDGFRTEYTEVEDEDDVTTHETRTREVSERVQTGERTFTCQRDLGNGYFESSTCTEPVYETRTRTESYDEPVTRRERSTRTVETRVPVYRAVPVYGTRYRWRVPQWSRVRTETLRGATEAPAWPALSLGPNQRAGPRMEHYTVTVRRRGGREAEVKVPLEMLDVYRLGRPVAVRTYRRDYPAPEVLPADSLPACRSWHAGEGDAPPAELGCSPRAAAK